MSLPSAADLLKVQLRHAWHYSRRVLQDLDDQEYFWEPTATSWSIRRRAPSVRGWGSGEFVCEDAWPAPVPLPTTTIGWRVIHLAAWTDIYRQYGFEGKRPDLNDFDIPGDANAGLAWLFRAQDDFIGAVNQVTDAVAFELRPAHWGESLPVVQLVTSMLAEHVHHIAEIGAVRDIRRGHARTYIPPVSMPIPPSWFTT